jgi:hypothetical protein
LHPVADLRRALGLGGVLSLELAEQGGEIFVVCHGAVRGRGWV